MSFRIDQLAVLNLATVGNSITAGSFVKSGGTSSQFLKADGSVDSNAYITGITSGMVTTALGYTPVPNTRNLTINGTTYDLSADRSWTITAGVSSVTASGAGISASPTTGAVIITNTGVTSNVAGTGISVSGATGAVTITNTGVTSLNGSTGALTGFATQSWVTSQGYLTAESDTLATVTARGASTSTNLTLSGRVTFSSAVATRPQMPGGILGLDTGDGNFDIWGISRDYYPSHGTAANAWGILWDGDNNQIRFIGAGTNRLVVDLDGGSTGALTWEGNNVWHAGNLTNLNQLTNGPGYITSASVGNGTLTLNVSGNGLSGSASFTANQSGATTFTVTSNATTSATANTLVYRDSAGDIYSRYSFGSYVNTSDNDETGITRFIIKNGDNYHRSATTTVAASAIQAVASGTWGINITGSAGSASSASSVPWTGVNAGTRTNYTLRFQPPASDYAGFEFNTSTGGGAGYFLVRGTSDNDVYTAEGITLVADAGWLTLAQRTSASKGVRIMTGVTSSTRASFGADGSINFTGDPIASNSFRAPIFYDSNDTNYYLDPNSTSVLYDVYVNGDIRMRGSDSYIWMPENNAYSTGFYDPTTGLVALNINAPSDGVFFGDTMWVSYNKSNNNNYNENIRLFPSANGASVIAFRAAAGSTGGTPDNSILGYSDKLEIRQGNQWQMRSYANYVEAYGSFRAPIFYDSQDTNYFVDPNSTSKISTLYTYGYIYSTQWIQFDNYTGLYSPNNNAHLRPNSGSFGPWLVTGTRNGWSGIEFESLSNGNVVMMIAASSNTSGWHNNSYGWQFKWDNGTAYVYKSAYGGGTSAAVLDSSNYTSYSPSLTGSGASGTWGISITGNADTVDGYHATNAASGLAYYASNGYLYVPSWININTAGIFSGTNNAHIRPNQSTSYGAWEMIGSRSGWSGIWFNDSGNHLMMNNNESGHYMNGYGWQFRWYQGTMYINRSTYGGTGTEYTVWDTGNLTNLNQLSNGPGYITSSSNVVGLYSSGFGNSNFTWYQSPSNLAPYSGSWASYLVSNHGDGATYYNQTIVMPFWGPPQYFRKEGGTNTGPYTFWTTENLNAYAVNMNQYVRTTDSPTFDQIYANGWFRNNSNNTGLYNQNTTQHWSSKDNGYWDASSTTSVSSIRLWTGGHISALRGYIYSNTSNEIGFLGANGNWTMRTVNGGDCFAHGTLYSYNDVVAYYSDERLKTKTGKIENALDKVMSLEGFTYTHNSLAVSLGYQDNKEQQIGLSAQEVQKIAPELVTLAAFDVATDEKGNKYSKSGENYLTVKYDRLVPVLIEAIKEQQKQIDELKKMLN